MFLSGCVWLVIEDGLKEGDIMKKRLLAVFICCLSLLECGNQNMALVENQDSQDLVLVTQEGLINSNGNENENIHLSALNNGYIVIHNDNVK